MPIYCFICQDCKHEFADILRHDYEKTPRCVACKSENTKRGITAPGGYHINGNNGASVRPKGAGYRQSNKKNKK